MVVFGKIVVYFEKGDFGGIFNEIVGFLVYFLFLYGFEMGKRVRNIGN